MFLLKVSVLIYEEFISQESEVQSYEELDATECLAGARQCSTEVLGQGILPTA